MRKFTAQTCEHHWIPLKVDEEPSINLFSGHRVGYPVDTNGSGVSVIEGADELTTSNTSFKMLLCPRMNKIMTNIWPGLVL
ncbi:hypothetical protein J2S45_000063 [Trueperella abortisuis]|uniref:Uncharacterized protein n=1 Tax=Trueperella abortisuis TaxID=445930 RepID=A0ABT9PFA0_9ACTO|nr:hypothetical protein [Trueperella abortisuis]